MTFATTASTLGTNGATTVSSITVNGVQIIPATTTSSTNNNSVANYIATGINACTTAVSGACAVTGYSATVSGNVVTVTGPTSASTFTPVITYASAATAMTFTIGAFPVATSAQQLQNFANWYSYYSNRMLMMKTGAGLAFSPISDQYRVGFLTMNNNVSPGILGVAPFNAAQRALWYSKLYAANPGNSTPLREALSHVGQYYAHKFGDITSYKSTITVGGSGSTGVSSITVNGTEIMLDTSVSSSSTSTVATNIAAQINLLDPSDYGASVSGSVITITGVPASLGYTPVVTNDGGGMSFIPTAFTASTTTAQLNGISPADPVEYSCQQNFTILSTDGYWNGSTTYNLANSPVGQQDGLEQRPMLDGASSTSTVTTPYTTTQRRQAVTSGATTTNTWSKSTTDIGASCTTSSTSPAGATSTAPMLDTTASRLVGLGVKTGSSATTSPDGAYCTTVGTNTSSNVTWLCRGHGTSSTNPVSGFRSATATDSAGVTWYLVTSGANTGTSCVKDTAINNGMSLNPNQGACPGTAGVSGKWVTITPYTQTETISGSTTTAIDDYIASQSTSHVVTNGVAGVESLLTPSTLTYTLDSHVSTSSTAATSDVFSAWTAGTPNPNNQCLAAYVSAASGTTSTTAAITNTSTTGGTTTTTVVSTTGPTAGTPTQTATTTTGGVSNTLADVAEYYYVTDLRDNGLSNCTGALGSSVCTNNVPSTGLDAASHQHMTTFTLGLGARGRMVYSPSYLTDTSGDFYSVKNGVTANGTTVCSWLSSGVCNWPVPSSGAVENIDDLWHAAVNGRGNYFSATDPTTLASGISGALAGISTRTGASAAATTSNPNVTSGDNFVFSSTFTTTSWNGELVRQQLDLTTGATSTTVDWAAQAKLDTKAALTAKAGSRTIYTYDSSNTNGNYLKAFNETNFGSNSYFTTPYISTSPNGLTQLLCTSATVCVNPVAWQASHVYSVGDRFQNSSTWYQVTTAYTSGSAFGTTDTNNSTTLTKVGGNNLVNFLRGDISDEGAETNNNKYFRERANVLGDIVNAEAVYVKASLYQYTDAGYADGTSSFVALNATRQGIVYAAANDGMLHAFYAADGTMDAATGRSPGSTTVVAGDEAWAYIPSKMLPELYRLADKGYATKHHYFVDGTPVVGDICPTAPTTACTGVTWKTILVGGFNEGGRGYYALDITNPAAPKALWEFTEDNLGYSFGNPKIAKLKDGTWVVMVTTGYNNVAGIPDSSYAGDGIGRLYVLNATTGALIRTISTGAGSATTPSGLSKIAARVTNATTDNTALAVYGGDLLGNLWRFDINNDLGASGYDAQLLTTLIGPTGVAQPITTKPELGDVYGNKVVYVGTGRYLGASDLSDQTVQSIYAIKDPLANNTVSATAIYANPRTLTSFKNQSPTDTTCPANSPSTICTVGQTVRTSPNLSVNFVTDGGWYMDLPDTGERANTDPTLSLGTLGFTTNVPNSDACTVGGYSFRYFIDYKTGGAVTTSTTQVVGAKLGNALATRPVYVRLPNGVVVELTRLSTGTTSTSQVPIGAGGTATRRTSWRELFEE
jgi:type IV pilus assembly protein PilY1